MSRLALLVGINKYKDDPLVWCVDDARAVRDALEGKEYGFTGRVLEDDRATTRAIKDALKDTLRTATDTALFYFAGHGVATDDGVYHTCHPRRDSFGRPRPRSSESAPRASGGRSSWRRRSRSSFLVLSPDQHGLQRFQPLVQHVNADGPQEGVGERGGHAEQRRARSVSAECVSGAGASWGASGPAGSPEVLVGKGLWLRPRGRSNRPAGSDNGRLPYLCMKAGDGDDQCQDGGLDGFGHCRPALSPVACGPGPAHRQASPRSPVPPSPSTRLPFAPRRCYFLPA
jgi:hypothetical protein